MKRIISDYVRSLGGSTAYSGNTRTMYINDPLDKTDRQSIESVIYNKFGFDLPFQLKTNN